jgi:hypothetical protein
MFFCTTADVRSWRKADIQRLSPAAMKPAKFVGTTAHVVFVKCSLRESPKEDWSRIAVSSAIRDQFSAEASMLRVDARELCGAP